MGFDGPKKATSRQGFVNARLAELDRELAIVTSDVRRAEIELEIREWGQYRPPQPKVRSRRN
jgi:hypothetical protein